MAVWKRTLAEEDHERLTSEHELARAYLADRRIQEAIELLEHVVAVESRLFDEDDPDRLVSLELLDHARQQLEECGTSDSGNVGSTEGVSIEHLG